MNQPLLSIVIPTYNRVALLELLLQDASLVLAEYSGLVQVVVSDNASTDRTSAVIETFRARWPDAVKLIQRGLNIGMEGNIVCSMLEGDGRYIWTISDHQRLCLQEVMSMLEQLPSLEFDIAHARVLQWSPILADRNKVLPWNLVTPRQRGALFFALGNLATLMLRRDLVRASAKSLFQSCVWSYPHLGFISKIDASTRVVEFDSLTAFPNMRGKARLALDYDKLPVCFHAHPECVRTLSERGKVDFSWEGFFTPEYRSAFRGDVMNYLLEPNVTPREAWRVLAPLIAVNPWRLKLIAVSVLLGHLLVPQSIRIRLATAMRGWLLRHKVQEAEAT